MDDKRTGSINLDGQEIPVIYHEKQTYHLSDIDFICQDDLKNALLAALADAARGRELVRAYIESTDDEHFMWDPLEIWALEDDDE